MRAEPVGGVAGEHPPTGLLRLLPDSGAEVQVKFEAQEVVGALLLFALDRKIPMPRESEKVLESIRIRFALRIGYYPLGRRHRREDRHREISRLTVRKRRCSLVAWRRP